MFLYLLSIIPGRVFIDPQMPLDSVNQIVAHTYNVGCGVVLGLAPSESRLWKKGVVTRRGTSSSLALSVDDICLRQIMFSSSSTVSTLQLLSVRVSS